MTPERTTRHRGPPAGTARRAITLAWLAVVVLMGRGASAAGTDVRTRHADPQDGPDIEVTLRISDDDVVLGLLMNLNFVDEIVDVPREDPQYLAKAEQPALRAALLAEVSDEIAVEIDGVPVVPVLDEFNVSELSMSLLPLFPRTGRRALTKVWMALRYDCKAPPRSVGIVWTFFPPERQLAPLPPSAVAPPEGLPDVSPTDVVSELPPIEVKIRVIAEGVERIVDVSPVEPSFTWHDEGLSMEERLLAVPEEVEPTTVAVPLVSLACLGVTLLAIGALRRTSRRGAAWVVLPVGLLAAVVLRDVAVRDVEVPFADAPLPSEEQAEAIFRPLHANIYRAFDYVDESDVYDALAHSVDGELLARLYDQVYRSLIMQDEGGAVSQVEEVRVLDVDVESIGVLPGAEVPGFTAVARWQVDGSVHHWGHSHERTNEYEARYTVQRTDEGWRIAGSQVLEQFRVEASPFDDLLEQELRDL